MQILKCYACNEPLTKPLMLSDAPLSKDNFDQQHTVVSRHVEQLSDVQGNPTGEYESAKSEVKNGHAYHHEDRIYTNISDCIAYHTNHANGCCKYDHFEVKCPYCHVLVGYGENDCWQIDGIAFDTEMVTVNENDQ